MAVRCGIPSAYSRTRVGDSGGPWFYWKTAYGVHLGDSNGNSAFTPVGTPLLYSNLTFHP